MAEQCSSGVLLAEARSIGDASFISSTMAQYPGFAAIIAAYVAGLPTVVANLKELTARNDLQSLRRLAHQQRGAGGGYGFEAITEIAGRLEDGLNTHESSEEIHRHVEDLTDLLRRVDGYVELT